MARVYVVTYVNDTEVYIDTVWSTRKKAEARVSEYGDTGPYRVEEWDVDKEKKK